MILAAQFAIIEEAGAAVLTLTEDIDAASLRRSRLTRAEVRRQLDVIARAAAALPPEARQRMPELDWDGWSALAGELQGEPSDDALWFAIKSLTPATLMWLRVYRQNEPALFDFTALAPDRKGL